MTRKVVSRPAFSVLLVLGLTVASRAADLEPLRYGPAGEAGPVVDLGVGLWAWPLPMDYDQDGDLDLVVSCPDVPFKGTYLFENPGGSVAERKFPVFLPPRRLGPGYTNIRPSYVGADAHRASVRLLTPAAELHWENGELSAKGARRPFIRRRTSLAWGRSCGPTSGSLADYDGDGRLDLIVGVGDWTDYGWDNAFDAQGHWTRGPLHGYVYLLRNHGIERAARVRSSPRQDRGRRQARSTSTACPRRTWPISTATAIWTSSAASSSTSSPSSRTSARGPSPSYAAGRRLPHEAGKPLAMRPLDDRARGRSTGTATATWTWSSARRTGGWRWWKHGPGRSTRSCPTSSRRSSSASRPTTLKFGALVTPVGCRLGRRRRRGPGLRQHGRLRGLDREPRRRLPAALGRRRSCWRPAGSRSASRRARTGRSRGPARRSGDTPR